MEAFVGLLKLAMFLGVAGGIAWYAFHQRKVTDAAWQLGLRDKGEVEAEGYTVRLHSLCNTCLRVGITEENTPVLYCWRCEVIVQYGDSSMSHGYPVPPIQGTRPYLRISNQTKPDGSVWPPPAGPPSAA